MSTSPRVLINSLEAFQCQGGGISHFSKTLIKALGVDTDLDILVDSRTNNSHKLLQYSSLFSVRTGANSRVFQGLNYFTNRFNPLGVRPINLTKAPEDDNLLPLCIKRLGIKSAFSSEERSKLVRFFGGNNIKIKSETQFSTKTKLTSLKLKLSKEEKSNIVFHNPYPCPIHVQGVKNIITIHDLIGITHPELCLSDPGREYELIKLLISKYDHIHFISDYAANITYQIFGPALQEKSSVVSQPILELPNQFANSFEGHIKRRRELYGRFRSSGEGYIIQVGTLEPKKNHMTSIEAFLILKRTFPNLRLVVVGKEGWLCDNTVRRLSSLSNNGIEWLDYASRELLIHLISNALAFVFPSIVEGWGLPPVEALALGTPAVVSNIPPCQQACQKAAIYIDNYLDPFSWSKKLTHLLETENLYLEQAIKGIELGQLQSPEQYQNKLHKMYQKVLEA